MELHETVRKPRARPNGIAPAQHTATLSNNLAIRIPSNTFQNIQTAHRFAGTPGRCGISQQTHAAEKRIAPSRLPQDCPA
jgi:hypothetical protein